MTRLWAFTLGFITGIVVAAVAVVGVAVACYWRETRRGR